MQRSRIFSTEKIFLFVIILIAIVIRFKAISWGNPPLITINEEKRIVEISRDMILTKDFNPHFFNYPSLIFYLIAFLSYLISAVTYLSFNTAEYFAYDLQKIYFIGRFLVFFFSILTIVLTYKIGKEIINSRVGIFSAAFLSLSSLHLNNSSIISVDSPMVCCVLLSFFFAIKIFHNNAELKNYLLAGLFIGLAVGFKYNAIAGFIFILLAHLAHGYESGRGNKKLFASIIFVLIFFLITTPYAIFDFGSFLNGIKYESIHYKVGHIGAEAKLFSYFNYFQILLSDYGLIPILLFLIGSVLLWRKNKSTLIFILGFPLIYFLFVGSFKVYFSRNMLVIIPFISLVSGYSANELFVWIFNAGILKNKLTKYSVLVLIMLILIAQSLTQANSYWNKINLTDTRTISKQWIEKNLPKDSKILRENYTPELSNEFKNVTNCGMIGKMTDKLDVYDYFILSSMNYSRILADSTRAEFKKNYLEIFLKYELLKEFIPDGNNSTGPTIKIYYLRSTLRSL